jgi:hypothetical protein
MEGCGLQGGFVSSNWRQFVLICAADATILLSLCLKISKSTCFP